MGVTVFRLIVPFLLAAAVSRAETNGAGADWPIFRGDSCLSGVAPGSLPDRFKPLWSFKIGHEVKSSPIIADGKVFIGSSDSNVYAIALADGTLEWKTQLDGPVEAPPLFVGGAIFVGSTAGTLHSLDAARGGPRWRFKAEEKIVGSANWVRSPDGKSVWILFGSYDNRIYAIDSTTGKKVWDFETKNYINGSPAADSNRVVFGGCDATLHAVSAADGAARAAVPVGSYVAASAALAGDWAFLGHYGGKLVGVNLAEKKQVWEYKSEEEGTAFFCCPAVGPDRIVIGARDNRVHAAARQDGKKLWTFQTRGEVDSSPVICGDKVVVGSYDGRLYVLKLSDGTEVWSREIGAAIGGAPAVAHGVIVVATQDGSVFAFGKDEKE